MTAGERLIVFTRFPVPGRVKTRLIPALGADGAAGLHRQLTLRTMRTAEHLRKHRSSQLQVHFEGGHISAMQHWLGDHITFVEQPSGHLGRRMASAFRNAFQEGMTAAIIIGTDCPQLSPEILNKAFDALRASDVVLGPAHDGGYYLIGLSRFIPEIFEEIAWGTERVLSQTLQALAVKGLQPVLLNRLPDIDQPEDLPIWYSVVQDEERDLAELSVIIPALNEARNISRIVEAAKRGKPHEIIVSDAGSVDGTAELAKQSGALVVSSAPGRARQMNAGVLHATGAILLFLHADTLLPEGYVTAVTEALNSPGVCAGAFGFHVEETFGGKSLLEWSTNFRSRRLQLPYGDQGLFIRRSLFEYLGGFADLPVMEDYEFIRRLRRIGRIVTLPISATTSGRRWRRLGVFRTTLVNTLMIAGYHAGVSPKRLARFYRQVI